MEEVKKNKGCHSISLDLMPNEKDKKNQCPEECDFIDCKYKCNIDKGNLFQYNEKTGAIDFEEKKEKKFVILRYLQYEINILVQNIKKIF